MFPYTNTLALLWSRNTILIAGLLVIASGIGFGLLNGRVKAAPPIGWIVSVGNPGACTTADPNCAAIGSAVASAAPGDSINVAAGTYNESDIVIDKDLTINGAGAKTTIVDAKQNGRVFITSCGTINISGLTIMNGFAGRRLPAAGLPSKNALTVNGAICASLPLSIDGGGIYNNSSTTLNLSACTVSNNATQNGNSFLLLVALKSNRRFAHVVKAGSASQLPGGGPGGRGGGIFNAGTLTLNNCTVSNNLTGNGGDSDTAGGNGGDGGGIFSSGTLTVTNSTIANNNTGRGGNIFNIMATRGDTATPLVAGAPGNGGEGGGISNSGFLALRNSTIAGNQTGPAGGFGIPTAAKPENGTVAPSDVSAAGGNGGGLYTGDGPSADIKSTLIANNSVGAGGLGPDVFSDILINSQGFNLVGKNDGSTGFILPTDQTGTIGAPLDPKLGPLGDNGGPTQTMALLTNSPAIDKGINTGCAGAPAKTATVNVSLICGLPFDQRRKGFPRTNDNPSVANAAGGDGTDVGAFEVQGGPCSPDTTPPTITCPGGLTKFTDSGQFTATVNPGTPVATDNCALQSVTGVRNDGKALNAPYPIGVTVITWTATDTSGNKASCGQSIGVMVPSQHSRRIP